MSNSSAVFDGDKSLHSIIIPCQYFSVSGILSVRLHQLFTEENLLIDATRLITNTFTKLLDYPSSFWSQIAAAIDCSSTDFWSFGKDVYRYVHQLHEYDSLIRWSFSALVHTNVKHGLTGDIAFNGNGERIESLYEIMNIQSGQSVVVGTYRSNTVSENSQYHSEEISDVRRESKNSLCLFF